MTNLLALVLLVALTVNIIYFDRLLRREYSIARTAWEMDGRPSGFFSQPSTEVSRSWLTRSKAAVRWWLTTPSWVHADVAASSVHKRYQVWSWLSFGAWLLFMWLLVVDRS
jgi:hypothetical protein